VKYLNSATIESVGVETSMGGELEVGVEETGGKELRDKLSCRSAFWNRQCAPRTGLAAANIQTLGDLVKMSEATC